MGGWGRNWAATVLPTVEAVELVGCVDAMPEALARARETLDLPEDRFVPALGPAMEALEPDAVLVTANVDGHVPLSLEALEAGRHVLVEKPFAATMEEARTVVEVAEERGLVLSVSQNYRYFPAPRAVAELVQGGELGPVGVVRLDFRRWVNYDAPRGTGFYGRPNPLLADMSIHHFDLLRMVLEQEPVEVSCHAWNPPWSRFTDPATATATITFDGGAVVSYRGSWVSPSPPTTWAGEWRMECERGEIAWTSRGDGDPIERMDDVQVRPVGKRARRAGLPAVPYVDRAGTLSAFAEAVLTGTEPETSGRDNLRSLALMSAMIESARTDRSVRL
jgi:predicted dehydrogenase